MVSLEELGWSAVFSDQLSPEEREATEGGAPSLVIARVSFISRDRPQLVGPGLPDGPIGLLPGHLFDLEDPFLVGDWVLADPTPDPPLVVRRLDRTSTLRRRSPAGGVQGVAANLDLALICTAHGRELNLRRVERWLTICAEADVPALILLTKADADLDVSEDLALVGALPGAEVLPVSGVDGSGLEEVRRRLLPRSTVGMLGSSGVGKSTLLNALCGEEVQATGAVRESDEKGRHTTSARTLHRLPGGALLMDNPGVREVGLIDLEGLDEIFPEVGAVLGTCQFRDCGHESEPGCALRDAVENGDIAPVRFRAWMKLQEEAREEQALEEKRQALIAKRKGRHGKRRGPRKRKR